MPMKHVTIILSVNVCVDLSSPQQVENFKVLLTLLREEGLDMIKITELFEDLKKHVGRSPTRPPVLVECIVCHQKFPDPQMLKEHAEEHRSKKLICGKCGYELETRSGMVYHYKTKHPGVPVPSTQQMREADTKIETKTETVSVEELEYYRCEHCGKRKLLSKKESHEKYERRRDRYSYKPHSTSAQKDPPASTVESKVTSTVTATEEPDSSKLTVPEVEMVECPCGMKVTRLQFRHGNHKLSKEHKERMAAKALQDEKSYVVDHPSDDSETCICGAEVLKVNIGIHQLTRYHKQRMGKRL